VNARKAKSTDAIRIIATTKCSRKSNAFTGTELAGRMEAPISSIRCQPTFESRSLTMKPRSITALTVAVALLHATLAGADGLIQRLPGDGTWVRYDVTGEGRNPAGDVAVTLKGTLTLKSVGRETVNGSECRWIETETTVEFKRRDRNEETTEILKLLIPESFLTADENPRAHVLKAWKKDRNGVRELDLKGTDAREIEGQDELFHAPISDAKKHEGVEFKAPAGNFQCSHRKATKTSQLGNSDVEFTTEAWLTEKIPFGVAGYRFGKSRSANGTSQGARTMELKVAESGTKAKSAIEK
jgi:hypothetical protein